MSTDLAGRRVVVTGATGFLGSHIVRVLIQRGATVVGAVRTPSKGEALRVEMIRADLGDPDSLRAAFEGADAVVANAALATRDRASYEEFRAANEGGARNQVEACAAAGVPRFIHISTVAVYKPSLWRVNRDTPLLLDGRKFAWSYLVTNWRYGLSKSHGERIVWDVSAAHDLKTTVLRPGPIYGSGDAKLTTRYAETMKQRVALAPTARVPHVHAADVAGAVAGALANPGSVGQAYDVTGEPVSPLEVLRTWRDIVGDGPRLVPVPVPVWMDFDDEPAIRDLGFDARSLEDGIREVLAFSSANQAGEGNEGDHEAD